MACVKKATEEKCLGLLSGPSDGETENGNLVAVDVWKTKTVKIHTSVVWAKLSDVQADCQMDCVCFCEVSEGFVVLGGYDSVGNKSGSQCWRFSFSSNQWKKLQDQYIPKDSVSAVVVGEVLLAIGGEDSKGDKLDVCEKMNIITRKWSSAKPLPHRMSEPLAAAAVGHVYIKDWMSRVFISYDPNTDSYANIPVPSFVPKNIYGACMVSYNDKLYLMGSEKMLAVQYDPHTQKWEQLEPPSAEYDDDGCCAVPLSGSILLCGGSTHERSEHDVIEEYDVEQNVWKQLDIRLPFQFDNKYCHVFKQST